MLIKEQLGTLSGSHFTNMTVGLLLVELAVNDSRKSSFSVSFAVKQPRFVTLYLVCWYYFLSVT